MKDKYGIYHKLTTCAEDTKEAFLKTVKDAEEKGIVLPDEIWVRVKKHNKTTPYDLNNCTMSKIINKIKL